MYVRILTFIAGLLIFSFANVSNIALAAPLSLVVKLSDIKVEKTSEKKGDEIYFSITEYSSLNRSKETRVPVQPTHWLSQNVDKLKNVVLWQGTIQESEEIKLIISMMEQDSPPWNPDDLIGNAELTIKNEKGTLHKEWKAPIFAETSEVEMKKEPVTTVGKEPQRFVFKGEKAHYDVAFDVQTQ